MRQNLSKILIIGGGGREHALAWKLKQSPKVGKIYVAPGNGGTAQVAENIDIKATDIDALADFAEKKKIDLTVVGQDDPLALGIVNKFKKRKLLIWGPTQAAARIEASKAFAKDLMQKANIPTARFQVFSNYDHALKYLETIKAPIVIKASGLALGKGVTVCKTMTEAKAALKAAMVEKVFGDAGNDVVIEEFLQGPEFSIHAFCDGKNFQLLPSAQDHKPIFDDGKGPNTGGMGTIAPVPWVNQNLLNTVANTIVTPILKALKKESSPFMGLLYPGLILTDDGPKVIEFNCRFGDPEMQSLMRLMKTDLFDVLMASVEGTLDKIKIEWHPGFACCIVLASGGYPGKYEKGLPITGIEQAEKLGDIVIFHAGTATSPRPSPHDLSASSRSPRAESRDEGRAAEGRERLVTNGGRVLGVTAIADDLQSALNKAYAAVNLINFDGMHYRTDIGQQSLSVFPSSPGKEKMSPVASTSGR